MKTRYWAKKKYSIIDPDEYTKDRFSTLAGRMIDETEEKAVAYLLLGYLPQNTENKLKILDVATGTGRLAFFLERNLKQVEITGVDINENMLKGARDIAKEKKSKIIFIKGDIYHLPFKKEQFDVVVGLRFSMHLPHIDKTIKEFSRILEKGGILIFDIFNYHSVLRIKLGNMEKKECGFYTIEEITKVAQNYGFKLLEHKGILLFGETILRKISGKVLFLFSTIIRPPRFLEKYSTKLLLCFKKI